MNVLRTVGLVPVALLLHLSSALAQSQFEVPTAVTIADDFSPMQAQWEPVTGHWSVSNGTYGDTLDSDPDITVITAYPATAPGSPPDFRLQAQDFTVRSRVRNQGLAANSYAGVIYGYQDSQNFYEAVISANGVVQIRNVVNGNTTVVGSMNAGIPRNQWCEIEVHWQDGLTVVKIDGRALPQVEQSQFVQGLLGLVTHVAVARFDKFSLSLPFGDQAFLQSFTTAPLLFTEQPGAAWNVANGVYQSGVGERNVSLAPIHTGGHPNDGQTFEYTFRARVLNPYGASGNLVGLVFNYQLFTDGPHYTEVVINPFGAIKLNRFENGVTSTVATAALGGTFRNVGIEMQLEDGPNHFAVVVQGVRLFEDVNIFDVNPEQFPEGSVGLITHWSPGKFDNAQFDHGFFQPCRIDFDVTPVFHVVSGTWDVSGGTLNSTGAGASDLANLLCVGNSIGEDAGTNESYTTRLLNQYGASGNLVGLIYNYQDPTAETTRFYGGDYYEVVFSPAGIVQMNKVIEGVRYTVASATHAIPRNAFFNVAVIRHGIFTTIKVNGATVFANVPQGDLRGGFHGAVTHWAKGKYDFVSLVESVVRPPSEIQ